MDYGQSKAESEFHEWVHMRTFPQLAVFFLHLHEPGQHRVIAGRRLEKHKITSWWGIRIFVRGIFDGSKQPFRKR